MLVIIRSFFFAVTLLFASQMDAQTWSHSYQKGDFGEDSYHFASAYKRNAQLSSASYIDYTLSLHVGRNTKGTKPFVYIGGDMVESLAWTVDAVKWTFEVKGEYITKTFFPSKKDNAVFFDTSDSAILVPLLKSGSRVRIEALTSSGNLFKEDYTLTGSTAAISKVQ